MSDWKLCCMKYPNQEIIYCSQVLLIYIVVITCVLNLSFSDNNACLWSSLLSGSVGYLLPAAKTRKKHEPILPDTPDNMPKKYYPDITLTHFITKLHNDVCLTGDWEVALAEIMRPRNWYNINEQYMRISCNNLYENSPTS